MLRKPLFWLLAFAFLHGVWYAIIVHPWQAPDEYLHYEYTRLIDTERTLDLWAEHRTSDIQRPVADSMWTFQHYRYRLIPTPPEAEFRTYRTPLGSTNFTPQPPLYYLLSLPIYWLMRTRSVLVQLYILRLFSVLLLCLTVWITYRLAKLIFSTEKDSWFVLFPAAFAAILPQYTFISASYNNDNLAPPLIAASLYALIKGYKEESKPGWLILAAVFGLLAITAKRTSVAILPILGLALIFYALRWLRSGNRWVRIIAIAILVGTALLFVATILFLLHPPVLPPDLARHLRLSPDALVRLVSFFDNPPLISGHPWSHFADLTIESFWGFFGWKTLHIPPIWVSLLKSTTIVLLVGILVGTVRNIIQAKSERQPHLPFSILILTTGLVFSLMAMAAQNLVAPAHYAPQGRYLFPFISGIAILAAWSWRSFWPESAQHKALLGGWFFLAIFDLVCWGFVIIPAWYT
ncbi:MAG: glycosyltransferase family 39 protein [Anaerolineales bacterium]